jgi:hypothetical protein
MKLKNILIEMGIFGAISGKDGVYGAFENPQSSNNKTPKPFKDKKYTKDEIIKLILKSKRNTIPKSKLEKVDISDLLNHYYEIR